MNDVLVLSLPVIICIFTLVMVVRSDDKQVPIYQLILDELNVLDSLLSRGKIFDARLSVNKIRKLILNI